MDKASSTIEEASSAALRVTVSKKHSSGFFFSFFGYFVFLLYYAPFHFFCHVIIYECFYYKLGPAAPCTELSRFSATAFVLFHDGQGSVCISEANTSSGFTWVSCKVNPCRCGASGQCRCHKTHKGGKQTLFYCFHFASHPWCDSGTDGFQAVTQPQLASATLRAAWGVEIIWLTDSLKGIVQLKINRRPPWWMLWFHSWYYIISIMYKIHTCMLTALFPDLMVIEVVFRVMSRFDFSGFPFLAWNLQLMIF